MIFKTKKMGSYDLHFIKTDKFKTITVGVLFQNKIKKEEISKTNFLSEILTYSTKNYKTRASFTKHKQDLYSLKIDSACFRMGNEYNLEMDFTMLDKKYCKSDIFDDVISFIDEIIFNPNVSNNAFDTRSFNYTLNEQIAVANSKEEDLKKFSIMEMLSELDGDSILSYSEYGYIEDIEKITKENLYDYYKEFIKKSRVDIFIVGNIEEEIVLKSFKDRFKFRVLKNNDKPIPFTYVNHKNAIDIIERRKDTNQSKLSIGCTIKNPISKFERNCVLPLYNLILGGCYDSRLFKIIREKYSLCYNVSSFVSKIDNLIIISMGINKENLDMVINLTKDLMDDMKQGKISDLEVENAKLFYKSSIDMSFDNPLSLITSFYSYLRLDSYKLQEKCEKTFSVTKKDIINFAKKVDIDTAVLIGGKDE